MRSLSAIISSKKPVIRISNQATKWINYNNHNYKNYKTNSTKYQINNSKLIISSSNNSFSGNKMRRVTKKIILHTKNKKYFLI